ncbi:MAG TPA: hypothetical protein DCY33_08700 [Gemmatimonadetes bacterium]|nr:hypothetical protein [Gemmatimonadota bacterium]
MTEVNWLDEMHPSPPEGLRVRLKADMMQSGQEARPDRLRDAARVSLETASARSGDRAAAFDLLLADAWITYACEAAMEREDPDAALDRIVSL